MKRIFNFFTILLILAFFISCSKDTTSPNNEYDIEYRVFSYSSYRVTVTYISQNGVELQEEDLYPTYSDPWSYFFKAEKGDYISVTVRGTDWYDSVSAAIYKDGVKWKEVIAQDLFPEATACGTLD